MKNFNPKLTPRLNRLMRRIKAKEIKISIDKNDIYYWNYERSQFTAMVIRFAEKKALSRRKTK